MNNNFNKFFKGFKKGMKDFGNNISLIINSILLTIVYLIGVGITSIIAKLSEKSFLDSKLSKPDEFSQENSGVIKNKLFLTEEKTYWNDLNLGRKNKEDYFRQF